MFFTWRDFAISQLVLWVGFKTNDQSSLQNHFGTKSRDESWRSDGVTAAQRNQFFGSTLLFILLFSNDSRRIRFRHSLNTKWRKNCPSQTLSISPSPSLSKCRFFHSRILQTHFHTHGASCKEACSYKPSSLSLSLLLSHSLISDARPRRGSPFPTLSLSLSYSLCFTSLLRNK